MITSLHSIASICVQLCVGLCGCSHWGHTAMNAVLVQWCCRLVGASGLVLLPSQPCMPITLDHLVGELQSEDSLHKPSVK